MFHLTTDTFDAVSISVADMVENVVFLAEFGEELHDKSGISDRLKFCIE